MSVSGKVLKVGVQHAVPLHLANQIRNKTFATSYLFTGDEEQKKIELAVGFAKALNCLKGQFFESCGCTSCSKVESGNHPDVKVEGLGEDEATLKIETIREAQSWLRFKPYEGRVKVFILRDADALTVEAQNALLKCLEEPPASSVLILLAKKKADLLDTIVSRCLEIRVSSYTEKELIEELVKDGTKEEEAGYLALISSGSLTLARQALKEGRFRKKNSVLDAILKDSVNGFESVSTKSREDVVQFLDLLSEWMRDLAVYVATQNEEEVVHADRLKDLRQMAQGKSLDQVFYFCRELEETRKAIDDYANSKLALARLQILWHEFLS